MQNSCAIWNILVSSPCAVLTLTRNFLMLIRFAAKRPIPSSTWPGRLARAEAQESIWTLWHKPRIAWRCYHSPILNQVAPLNVCLAARHMNIKPEETNANSGNKPCSLWYCNVESVADRIWSAPDGGLGNATINCKPPHLYTWMVLCAS